MRVIVDFLNFLDIYKKSHMRNVKETIAKEIRKIVNEAIEKENKI